MISALRRFLLRLYSFLRPGSAERQLEREIAAHLALLEDEYVRRGLTREAAALAAARALGGVARTKDLHRDTRSFIWLEDARQDLRYAGRMLGRSPGFTSVAILTLALGIGSVTLIASVIQDLLLDPLPYPGSNRFVNVLVHDLDSGRRRNVLPAAEFLDFQAQTRAFEAVIGTRGESMILTTPERTEVLRVILVTPNFFEVMGLRPLIGRAIGPEDASPDAPAVAVLRHRAWVSHFGADAAVIGRTIVLNGAPRTIVGVMPPRFTWHAADMWIPAPIDGDAPDARAAPRNFQARLRPDVSVQQAEAQLNVIAERRARVHPDEYPANFRVHVVNVIESVVGDFRRVLYTAFAAVALLMLIACCNVANMLLARATAREREITIRAALGAGRGRIVRQVLVESLLLSLLGAACGCAFAYAGIALLVPLLPEGPLPGEVEFGLDGAVLAFTLAVAILAALAFGIAPALYGARRNLLDGLRGEGKAVASDRGRLKYALVVAEIALSVVLLLGAGLLMRSFVALLRVDLGFDPERIFVSLVTFAPGEYDAPVEKRRFYERALLRIASVPGVQAVAATSAVPPFGWGADTSEIEIVGSPRRQQRAALIQFSTEGYFRTIGLPVVRGRTLRAADWTDASGTAVVNQTFAGTHFGRTDPIGQQIAVALRTGERNATERTVFVIVGVIADVRNQGVRDPAAPQVYLPRFPPGGNPAIIVRTAADPRLSLNAIRQEIRTGGGPVAIRELGTIEELLQRSVYAQPRFSLIVLGMFAVSGALLVAIGVFSVMAYAVSRQTREIAVRVALGACQRDVIRMVLRRGAHLVVAGVAAGVAGSVVSSRIIASQLWNTSPYDPISMLVAIVSIAAIALAACYLPARRAVRIDPITALRQD